MIDLTGEGRAYIPVGLCEVLRRPKMVCLTEYKVCLKTRGKKKKSMTGPGQLEPAVIQFMLKCLQESARWSGNFFFLFSGICIHKI